jgi:hypothetical protein
MQGRGYRAPIDGRPHLGRRRPHTAPPPASHQPPPVEFIGASRARFARTRPASPYLVHRCAGPSIARSSRGRLRPAPVAVVLRHGHAGESARNRPPASARAGLARHTSRPDGFGSGLYPSSRHVAVEVSRSFGRQFGAPHGCSRRTQRRDDRPLIAQRTRPQPVGVIHLVEDPAQARDMEAERLDVASGGSSPQSPSMRAS